MNEWKKRWRKWRCTNDVECDNCGYPFDRGDVVWVNVDDDAYVACTGVCAEALEKCWRLDEEQARAERHWAVVTGQAKSEDY